MPCAVDICARREKRWCINLVSPSTLSRETKGPSLCCFLGLVPSCLSIEASSISQGGAASRMEQALQRGENVEAGIDTMLGQCELLLEEIWTRLTRDLGRGNEQPVRRPSVATMPPMDTIVTRLQWCALLSKCTRVGQTCR